MSFFLLDAARSEDESTGPPEVSAEDKALFVVAETLSTCEGDFAVQPTSATHRSAANDIIDVPCFSTAFVELNFIGLRR